MSSLTKGEYDIRTAVTFLLAGLGIGSLIAILFTPRPASRVAGIHRVSPRVNSSTSNPPNVDLRRAL